jgi:uncharacterized NAD-dependent epimerase/dehydratase family protein
VLIGAEDRVAILLHQGIKGKHGKTGLAFLRYSEAFIVAAIDSESAGESLSQLTGINKNVPIVGSVKEALKYSPNVLLIGIAPSGGALPEEWWQEVKLGVEAGLSLVNGLHTPMQKKFDSLRSQQWIWDIRQEPQNLKIGSGKARSLGCQRILTVGTDMAIGKMSTSIELDKAARKKGFKSKFLATGQAGIMIVGDGLPLDAVRVDFAAGAVEQLVINCGAENDLLFIEGQGSLLHPGSTATLPLIRGSQPTALVLVHRCGQKHIRDFPEILIPPLTDVIHLYETVTRGAGSFADVKVKAIALNTFHLDIDTAKAAIEEVRQKTGLPCTDVVRFGADFLLERLGRVFKL